MYEVFPKRRERALLTIQKTKHKGNPMSDKPKILKPVMIVSPVGVGNYIYVHTPDTKFDAVGDYKLDLTVGPEEAQEFIEKFNELIEAQYEEVLKVVPKKDHRKIIVNRIDSDVCSIEKEYDDDGDETGNFILKFKNKAEYTSKKDGKVISNKPLVVDCTPKSEGGPHSITQAIWSGSKLRVKAQMKPWFFSNKIGIKLQFKAVQVIELAEGSSGGDDFDDFSGGYSAPVSAPAGVVEDDPEVDEEEDF